MYNILLSQTHQDFVKKITDDRDLQAWECGHFARELACCVERKEENAAWVTWVRAGFDATRGELDQWMLDKVIQELGRIANRK